MADDDLTRKWPGKSSFSPEYLVRSIRNTIKKKDKEAKKSMNEPVVSGNENIGDLSNHDEITIKEEPLSQDENYT